MVGAGAMQDDESVEYTDFFPMGYPNLSIPIPESVEDDDDLSGTVRVLNARRARQRHRVGAAAAADLPMPPTTLPCDNETWCGVWKPTF